LNHDTTAPAGLPAPERAQPEQASPSPQRARLAQLRRSGLQSIRIFVRDVGHGLMEVSHNTLALVGLAAVATLIFVAGRADLRHQAEVMALDWLQDRHTERELAAGNLLAIASEPDAVARATAADPGQLTREQAAVANWLSRRYRVAPEPVSALVKEAWAVGEQVRLDPTLILAIMAIESRFNPFAQSSVGAQGLMQVMTRVHTDKYESFGGTFAAFDPISNLRVGVQVLKECIARAGSVYDGLRYYVGAALLSSDGGYAGKVLSEQAYLRAVASGQKVPVNAAHNPPPPPVREATLVETAEEGAEAAAPAPEEAASAADALPARVALLAPSR
jgi:soluble lytic murein transglycosylase-like protein